MNAVPTRASLCVSRFGAGCCHAILRRREVLAPMVDLWATALVDDYRRRHGSP
jgi:hypothetical protein